MSNWQPHYGGLSLPLSGPKHHQDHSRVSNWEELRKIAARRNLMKRHLNPLTGQPSHEVYSSMINQIAHGCLNMLPFCTLGTVTKCPFDTCWGCQLVRLPKLRWCLTATDVWQLRVCFWWLWGVFRRLTLAHEQPYLMVHRTVNYLPLIVIKLLYRP